MNCGLTPASERSPFHATTISLAGMVLCVFTTVAVLLSVSRDQSGATVAEVTAAFNGSLGDHGRNDVAVIAASFRQAAGTPDDSLAGKSRSGVNARGISIHNDQSLATSEEEEAGELSNEKLRPIDVNGPVFSHLMTELQRYCQVSAATELGGQLALDLHSQIPLSDDDVRNAIKKILETCRKPDDSTGQLPAEFEVIVWASTPATAALAAAAQEAFALEQTLGKSLKAQAAPSITISSSGRIWTRPQSPRPLATVVVRSATHTAPSH